MNNTYHLQIMKMYDDIREQQKKSLVDRKEEIKTKIPQISSIEREIGKLCIKVSINALQDIPNRDEHLQSLRENITNLRMRKSELLVSNNYDIDYLDIQYTCSKCKDTGFIGLNKCTCYKQKLNKLYYRNSELFLVSSKNNFDNFNIELFGNNIENSQLYSPRDNMRNNVRCSLNFINHFDSSSENLLFYGNPGTGKTFLTHCIALDLVKKGYFVIYKTSEALIKILKDAKFNNNIILEDHVLNCDLLIIDDLGTEVSSEFSKAELFNLLNTKLLKNKKMIISTNYELNELSSIYSERITSRLFGSFTLCKFYGDDLRLKKRFSK